MRPDYDAIQSSAGMSAERSTDRLATDRAHQPFTVRQQSSVQSFENVVVEGAVLQLSICRHEVASEGGCRGSQAASSNSLLMN